MTSISQVARSASRMFLFPAILLSSCGLMRASAYPAGYVWQRAANWVLAGATPAESSRNDSQGNAVWSYTSVNGGALIHDPGSDKWWQLTRSDLTAGNWFGTPVFLYGTQLPYFSASTSQVTTNDLNIAPLAVWKNPAGNGVSIRLGGSVGWSGPGGGTNTVAVDYVLALHRVADNSWQTLDSAVLAPPGSATLSDKRDYSGAQALGILTLNAGDEIVWGFKRADNFNNGISWMNMHDSLSFTLESGVTATDITVAAPVSGSSVATFTVSLNEVSSVQVNVGYATMDGSALAGTDYGATGGTLTFAAGETIKTVEVPIFSQTVPKPDKTFSLLLDYPIDNGFVQSSALCTIVTSQIAAATNLVASVKGISGIELAWSEPAFLPGGYLLERSSHGGAFATIARIPAGTGTWLDADIQAGITYHYRLVSYNAVATASTGTVEATLISGPNAFPPSAFLGTREYGTMWWRGGVRGERVWQIKTSRYAMTFDCDSLNLSTIFPLSGYLPETAAFVQPNQQSFPATAPASSLSLVLNTEGSSYPIGANSTNNDDSQLLESGKFFQRRWQKIKSSGASSPTLNTNLSGIEVCAWPDRVSIICRMVPTNAVTDGDLQMTLSLQNIYNILSSSGAAQALASGDGNGFVLFKSAGTDSLIVDPATSQIKAISNGGTWAANQERSVGLVIYPSSNVASTLPQAERIENAPLLVTASQTAPAPALLSASYVRDQGYFEIPLRNDAEGSDENRVERNRIVVSNTTSSPQLARFAFTKGAFPYAAGYSCLLRDMDGNPLGIPVQLSKNWHVATGDRWEGPWFHGLTMLTVPANTTLSFEAFLVGQNYGGVPAASHSQLSLVGWGHNQQWEEAAIGCWGESLCYEPDSDQADTIGTDARPLMLLSNTGQQKQWTGNYGGCDFLRYYNGAYQRVYQNRLRTQYQRYGPGLTDVTYAGLTNDSRIELQYSASLYRSNDFTRGSHRIRYDVKADAPFTRMVFFQLAADSYNYNGGTTHAYGYGNQLTPTAEWTTTDITTPVELTGPLPWFSTLGCPVDPNVPSQTGATRGFVIRSWKARINGVDNVSPSFVASGSRFDLVPQQGVTTLKAGDYVEAEIERFYFGQEAAAYYGGDANFTTALQNHGNSHQMALREVIGNDLAVTVTTGILEKSYPIQIRAANNSARFSVMRGVGYVPVTFTGLTDYRKPVIEEQMGADWVAVNQATVGNDFWQTDYDPESASWQITYNIKLDAAYQDIASLRDAPVTRNFRFRQEGAPTFDAWIGGPPYNLTGPDAAFDADPDNDGIANGLEWILGGNPTTGSTSSLPTASRDPSGNLVLTFTREEDSINQTTLTLEYGTDLASPFANSFVIDADGGTDGNGVTVAIDQDASPNTVTITIPATTPEGKLFARLRVSHP